MKRRNKSRSRGRDPGRRRSGPPGPPGRDRREPYADASWRRRRRAALLHKVERDLSLALSDRRCRKPDFCEEFFELCDDKCLQQPGAALEFAQIAVELARKTGDRHLRHRARGLLVHAHIAGRRWAEAAEVLEDYRAAAFACCAACAGDWLRRRGDHLVETGDAGGAREALERALEELADDLDEDMHGRIRFLRGIAHHFERDSRRALEDAGEALLEMSLATPQGYFLDATAFIACFLQFTGERRYYQQALTYLARFRERLKGVEGWTSVRLRLSWVEALVLARLGERRKAVARLERVFNALHGCGPARHAVAAMIDLAQLLARRCSDTDQRAIKQLINRCVKLEIDRELLKCLEAVKQVVSNTPERALTALAYFRFSFIVPVPGLLSEAGRLR